MKTYNWNVYLPTLVVSILVLTATIDMQPGFLHGAIQGLVICGVYYAGMYNE